MGMILNGVYYPKTDISKLDMKQQSTWKQHDHDRQRKDHAAELVQPYNRDGSVNDKFIEAFPLESKEVYHFLPSDEELLKK